MTAKKFYPCNACVVKHEACQMQPVVKNLKLLLCMLLELSTFLFVNFFVIFMNNTLYCCIIFPLLIGVFLCQCELRKMRKLKWETVKWKMY